MSTRSAETSASQVQEQRGDRRIALHLMVGPLSVSPTTRTFLWLYLLTDGYAAWQFMNGSFALAAVIFLLGRVGALTAWRALRIKGKPGVARRAMRIDAVLYSFTVLTIAASVNSEDGLLQTLRSFPAPTGLRDSYASAIDDTITYITLHAETFFQSMTAVLLWLLSALEAVLTYTPWPVFFAVIGVLAWRRGGLSVLILCWVALGYWGAFGYWAETMETLALVIASLVICIVIGVPLGILLAKNRFASMLASPVLDLMQTMPSFVYLLPAVAFFSIGKPPALIATVIFSLPPLVRLTCLGIQQVPVYVLEALHAHGATPLQTLIKAELPLALPSIRTGINQTIMMCLSMVVIAALIGGGGLGYNVLFALQNVQYGQGTLAGLAIVFCAVLFDRLIRATKQSEQH